MGEAFQFEQGDETWLRLRHRSLNDLFFFASTILGYGELIPMRLPTHGLLCKFIERKTGVPELDEAPYQLVEMPRETGKTTLDNCRIIQRICQDPVGYAGLICNERVQNSQDFLKEIKHHFETNELLRALFPECCPDEKKEDAWSASRISVPGHSGRKEPTLSTIGLGGTITGMHFPHIVVDDIISREAMENARAGGNMMEQVNRWLHQLIPLRDTSAKPFPQILFIGTRWWHGDCYEHIVEFLGYGAEPKKFMLSIKLEDGTKQQVMAERIGDLAIFRRRAIEHGRSIFPEKWSLEDLAKIRMADPALFACNYMNSPSDEVTSELKSSWLQFYDWTSPNYQLQLTDGIGKRTSYTLPQLDILVFVDPGGFGASGGSDRMRPAIVCTGTTPEFRHLVLDCYSEPDTFLTCANVIVEWCRKYSPRKVLIEQAGQQAAFIELVRRIIRESGLTVSIEAIPAGNRAQDKDRRILELEPVFQQGMCYIGKGHQFHEFRTQYEQFPRSRRKDLLDALAWGPQYWRRPTGSSQKPQDRIQQELTAYRQRRGMPV